MSIYTFKAININKSNKQINNLKENNQDHKGGGNCKMPHLL